MSVEYEEPIEEPVEVPVEESNDNDREDPHFSDIILLIGIILIVLSIIVIIVDSITGLLPSIILYLSSFGLLIGAWGIAFRILMHQLYIIPNVVVRTIVDFAITLPVLIFLMVCWGSVLF